MHFDQYSHLAIRLNYMNISWFSANNSKMNLKKIHEFVELVEANPLTYYNTLQFDQYSRLAIRFFFFANNSKMNLKFDKENYPLVSRAHRDESIDV